MQFVFEWDIQKAITNNIKHGVTFELASTVFKDPVALSVYDPDHSEHEDRWLTLGLASTGILLVVHHTFVEVDKETVALRIISSRKATKREQLQYAENQV